MRVHVVSDVHGAADALARAGDGADALVVLGDLGTEAESLADTLALARTLLHDPQFTDDLDAIEEQIGNGGKSDVVLDFVGTDDTLALAVASARSTPPSPEPSFIRHKVIDGSYLRSIASGA